MHIKSETASVNAVTQKFLQHFATRVNVSQHPIELSCIVTATRVAKIADHHSFHLQTDVLFVDESFCHLQRVNLHQAELLTHWCAARTRATLTLWKTSLSSKNLKILIAPCSFSSTSFTFFSRLRKSVSQYLATSSADANELAYKECFQEVTNFVLTKITIIKYIKLIT